MLNVMPPIVYRTDVACKSPAQCIFGMLPENISLNNSSVYGSQKEKAALLK